MCGSGPTSYVWSDPTSVINRLLVDKPWDHSFYWSAAPFALDIMQSILGVGLIVSKRVAIDLMVWTAPNCVKHKSLWSPKNILWTHIKIEPFELTFLELRVFMGGATSGHLRITYACSPHGDWSSNGVSLCHHAVHDRWTAIWLTGWAVSTGKRKISNRDIIGMPYQIT